MGSVTFSQEGWNGIMRPEKDSFRRKERGGRENFPREEKEIEENEGQLEGRNALTEALRSGRTIDKVTMMMLRLPDSLLLKM